jgi:hypothetical protein
MDTAVYVLAALLCLTVGGMVAGLILSIRALASIKDREILHRTLVKFSDRLVMEKDQQLDRLKMEAQVEMGADYMQAQTEIEKVRARRGENRTNGQLQPAAPDVRVEMDS